MKFIHNIRSVIVNDPESPTAIISALFLCAIAIGAFIKFAINHPTEILLISIVSAMARLLYAGIKGK